MKNILREFLQKRLIFDAIVRCDVGAVRTLLGYTADTSAFLADPVDEYGNTLLHIAVRQSSREVTERLIRAGANPALRNWRGDLPTQRFMCPLRRPGAHIVRKAALGKTSEIVELSQFISSSVSFNIIPEMLQSRAG